MLILRVNRGINHYFLKKKKMPGIRKTQHHVITTELLISKIFYLYTFTLESCILPMTMGHNVYVDLMNILDSSIYIRLACSIWEFSQGVVCGSSLDYIDI